MQVEGCGKCLHNIMKTANNTQHKVDLPMVSGIVVRKFSDACKSFKLSIWQIVAGRNSSLFFVMSTEDRLVRCPISSGSSLKLLVSSHSSSKFTSSPICGG